MSRLDDAIDSYVARAAAKVANLTPEERQSAADREVELARNKGIDQQIAAFDDLVRARVESMKSRGGSNLPEIDNIVRDGGTWTGDGKLRLTSMLHYALPPAGGNPGMHMIIFSADPINDVVSAVIPTWSAEINPSPPIVLGTCSFDAAQAEWIDTMLAQWLERAQP
jgi:hypothetical protein